MRLDELYQLGRRLQELAQSAMSDRDVGVSPAEVVVMRDLLAHGEATISQVASRTGFVHSRVSTAVASLRDRGWAVTSVDETDRRRTIATVTERVRRGAAQARAGRAEPVLSELLPHLPAERRAEVIEAVKELHRTLTERHVQRDRPKRSFDELPDVGGRATPAGVRRRSRSRGQPKPRRS